MPQGKLILDMAILTALMAVPASMFYIALFLELVPWPIRIYMLSSGALAVLIFLWIMPAKYSLEGGVVRLCSPIRCAKYEVEGMEEGEVYNPRRWKMSYPCFGFHGFRLTWVKCSDDHIYFATARCRDVWKKLQIRKGDEKYTLWLCIDSHGSG